MALHDYRCPVCGAIEADVNVPIAIGAMRWSVECPVCPARRSELTGVFRPQFMEWIPAVGAMDASSGPGFTAFEAMDGRNEPVVIDSVHKARQVERESEQLARNKEGQQIAFRALSQTKGNQSDNAFGDPRSHRKPFKTRNTRGVPFVSRVGAAPEDA